MATGKGKLDSTKIVSFATHGIVKISEPVVGGEGVGGGGVGGGGVGGGGVDGGGVRGVGFGGGVGAGGADTCSGSFSQMKLALQRTKSKKII